MGTKLSLKPRARIVATATSGADPTIMLTGPTPATVKLLKTAGLGVADIDLFEINEAFASVVLKYQKDLGIPDEKLNVNGGAIAMGHPLASSGVRLMIQLRAGRAGTHGQTQGGHHLVHWRRHGRGNFD